MATDTVGTVQWKKKAESELAGPRNLMAAAAVGSLTHMSTAALLDLADTDLLPGGVAEVEGGLARQGEADGDDVTTVELIKAVASSSLMEN